MKKISALLFLILAVIYNVTEKFKNIHLCGSLRIKPCGVSNFKIFLNSFFVNENQKLCPRMILSKGNLRQLLPVTLYIITLISYFFLCAPSKADVVPEHHRYFRTYIDKQGREVKKPDNRQNYQIPLEHVKIEGNNGFYFYTEGLAVIPKCILNKERKCIAENEKEIMLMCSAEAADGKWHHEPGCNAQSWFNEGLAPVRFDGKPPEKESDYYYKYKSGYINKEGKIVLETDYWELYPFNEGLAQFCINKLKCGFIDKTGRVVIKPKYSYLSYFNNGIAEAHGYIDTRKSLRLPAALLGLFIIAACALFVFSRRSE